MHYLDNAATTPVRPEAVRAIEEALTENFGNPSSLHGLGVRAERTLKGARESVARLVGASPAEIVFTSGGTEAINLAIKGVAGRPGGRGRHVVTSRAEHPATLEACRALEDEGFEVTYLPVTPAGNVTVEAVQAALRPDTVLVTLMYVNNELGAVNPVAEVGRLLQGHPALYHVDAVQAAGKLPVRVREIGCDLLTLSAHKIHGPKGVGGLYVRSGLKLRPLLHGGGQEGGLRSGTENLPGIAGFGAAAAAAAAEQPAGLERLRALRERLLAGLAASGLEYWVNGPDPAAPDAAPHILNLSFRGVPRGEVLVHALEARGVYVSTGSACHSRHRTMSHVLEAIRLPRERAEGAIRVSLSPVSRPEDVDAFVDAVRHVVPELGTLYR